MLGFGLGLNSQQGYVSKPWSWLVLGRPVSFFYDAPKTCVGGHCSREVLAIGTPAIWWACILALLFCLGWWISRRDWRAGVVMVGVAPARPPPLPLCPPLQRAEHHFSALAF